METTGALVAEWQLILRWCQREFPLQTTNVGNGLVILCTTFLHLLRVFHIYWLIVYIYGGYFLNSASISDLLGTTQLT